ncbi:MAG: LytR C-terminal domain-containing protein [Bacteroidota bacterium]
MAKKQSRSPSFALNAVIGFLGLLLGVLLFALATRVIYPRIQNTRAETPSNLIGNVIQIEVLNGCGVPGLANDFTDKLRRHGFDVVETGNFDNFDIDHTLVISRTGNMANAQRVARTLGIEEKHVIREESPDFYLDATIIIGSDFKSLNLN